MYKPPLFHWTAAALDRLAGIRRVDTFNLRFPSALYAIAGAVLTIGFALDRFGPTPAALSGLILAASYQYISQGRIGRVDMALTFFEALSLFSFLWWLGAVENKRSSRHVTALHFLLAAAMGLGVMAKGPVGAILPGLAIGLFLVIEKRWTELRSLMRPLPLMFGATLAVSWYVICLAGGRYNFLNRQIGSENFGRFFGSLGRMPLWYYVQPLLLNAGPISLLIPVAVVTALVLRRTRGSDSNVDDNNSGASELDCVRVFAMFWIASVVFFELAAYKRKAYLLPLWPPSAILLAWWTWRIARPRWGRKIVIALATVCVGMAAIDFFFIPWQETHYCGVKLSAKQTLEWPFLSLYGKEPSYVTRQDWLRSAARKINGVMSANQPLFTYRFAGAVEPWMFYLHRRIVQVYGPINRIPSGYVLVRIPIWKDVAEHARGFTKLLTLPDDHSGLVLLHHDTVALAEPVLMRSPSTRRN
jgi:4-amino-4-deoxy-L-arabinose transferase-like glycosyltransferase